LHQVRPAIFVLYAHSVKSPTPRKMPSSYHRTPQMFSNRFIADSVLKESHRIYTVEISFSLGSDFSDLGCPNSFSMICLPSFRVRSCVPFSIRFYDVNIRLSRAKGLCPSCKDIPTIFCLLNGVEQIVLVSSESLSPHFVPVRIEFQDIAIHARSEDFVHPATMYPPSFVCCTLQA